MPHKFYKFRLLLDENLSPRLLFPRLNHRYDVKHLSIDLKLSGLTDQVVYDLARKTKRLILTLNDKDFAPLIQKTDATGIIGISPHLSSEQIDKKVTAFLIKSTPKMLYGTFHFISGETT